MDESRFDGDVLTRAVAGDPPSPCRRACLLEGRVCLGCGRSLEEIAAWPEASAVEKRAILRAAAIRREAAKRNESPGIEPVARTHIG